MDDFESSTESLELSSSSEIHPNIDEKSYKNWKRQARKTQREEMKKKLNVLNSKSNLTDEEQKEKEDLIKNLTPQFKIKSDSGFRTGDENIVKEIELSDVLVNMLENQSLEYFSENVNKIRNRIDDFEELILYNLSENIKESNDELGIILSRICLLLGYYNTHGKGMLDKLIDELKIPTKKASFDEDVQKYYNESKYAILNMNKEE